MHFYLIAYLQSAANTAKFVFVFFNCINVTFKTILKLLTKVRDLRLN